MHKIDKFSELSNILCEKDGHGKKTVALNERTSPTCRKYKCRYFRKDVVFEGMQLRLLFVQYGRNRTWKILLTTDKSLSSFKVFEYYQIRWNQEVMRTLQAGCEEAMEILLVIDTAQVVDRQKQANFRD